jgi:hypothetical protein
VTVSNFRYDFPPFTLMNITLGNIVNGPVAGVTTAPYFPHPQTRRERRHSP